MSALYTGIEGQPKNEKVFIGIIPPPPPSTYPLPSAVPVPIPPPDESPGAQRMETATSAATVLPPGGYPKTPPDSSTSVKIVPISRSAAPATPVSTTRQQQASQGTVGTKKRVTVGQSLSRKSVQDPAGESGNKGWVLVNVEPSREASLDAAIATMAPPRPTREGGASRRRAIPL